MRRRIIAWLGPPVSALLLSLGAWAGWASLAAAATSTPSKPAKATVALYLPDAFFVSRQAVTVPGRVVHIGAVVRPYVAGQWVKVRVFLGSRLVKSDRLRLKPSANHSYGRFTESFSS